MIVVGRAEKEKKMYGFWVGLYVCIMLIVFYVV